eukprot:872525-Amphidinium_carterae.1
MHGLDVRHACWWAVPWLQSCYTCQLHDFENRLSEEEKVAMQTLNTCPHEQVWLDSRTAHAADVLVARPQMGLTVICVATKMKVLEKTYFYNVHKRTNLNVLSRCVRYPTTINCHGKASLQLLQRRR